MRFGDLVAGVSFLNSNHAGTLSTLRAKVSSGSRATKEPEHEKQEDNDEECEREHHLDRLAAALVELRIVRKNLGFRKERALALRVELAVTIALSRLVDCAIWGSEGVGLGISVVADALEAFREALCVLPEV